MNTPAHAIVNLLVLGRGDAPKMAWPILAGGVVPDLPIVAFYAVEKLRGTSEAVIWSTAYYRPEWQLFIDLWNSLPIMVLGFVVARLLDRRAWALFFASMGLHALADLPLHNDDGHRHFLPFSSWRFESPVSYWDPAHGGQWVTLAEIALVGLSCWLLLRRFEARGVRLAIVATAALYGLYFGFVALVWL